MKKIALFQFLLAAITLGYLFAAEQKTVTAQIDKDGIQRVDILAGSYFFNPNHIILKVNVPTEIKIRKEAGLVPHDITMNSPEAGMKFHEGIGEEPKIIGFVPTRTGKYPFWCSKKFLGESHRKKGMEGTIEVVP